MLNVVTLLLSYLELRYEPLACYYFEIYAYECIYLTTLHVVIVLFVDNAVGLLLSRQASKLSRLH